MKLDHATIVTGDLEATLRFFCKVVGLDAGPRPPFAVRGHWLYADGQPIIHLVDATVPASAGRVSPRIDHIALRTDRGAEWAQLVERLRLNDIPYELTKEPRAGELQLFVALAPGLIIEFVTALAGPEHPRASGQPARRNADPGGPRWSVSHGPAPTTPV
jgi:catechol 2,3-dioxygenase-like lactoylglutathione lyase family enzyme